MILFVSDLHLGDAGPLEDFAFWNPRPPRPKTRETLQPALETMHAQWSDFIDHVARCAKQEPQGLDLVLLGDVFDLLQTHGTIGDPRKIHRIAKAHRPWTQALHRAHQAGTRVHWVVGNHDHELLHENAWNAVLEYMPFMNKENNNKPLAAWRNAEATLHAEHGSQFDPYNAIDDFANPEALALGSRIVLGPLNALEPTLPLLDLMPDLPTALWYALSRRDGLLARPLRDFLFAMKNGNGQQNDNLDYLKHTENYLCRVWMNDMERKSRTRLRSILQRIAQAVRQTNSRPEEPPAPRQTGTKTTRSNENHPMRIIQRRFEEAKTPPYRFPLRKTKRQNREPLVLHPDPNRPPETLPETVQILVTGHTHAPGIRRKPDDGLPLWLDTGSWKARAKPVGRNRFAIEQPLDVLVVHPNHPGAKRKTPGFEYLAWAKRKRNGAS